ncbi:5'-AMP-activated protein kinase beta subunit, interation domain-containing protein [Emericellopsis atlantica]|uniref:5'-AMP-activated protein kinase beta subunit, interation domain-containing protein n=1 Tax=Emericellopsis atlantica TaxID=2614577 RepID=A0A9P7ZNH0_9HYPO|nr:5'-AMP-activated protein kinase beta subunit, interation domain-containing protein [Emericellopsis atlantica]KAG9255265.1 5'-AMP-activated protein kinase beta subunit, interation domain-containing protein [Emericellopsis atlantica]
MGNHPSSTSSKPQTPTGASSGSATPHGHDSQSPRHSRNHTRNILQHSTHQRSAAPPEASLAQAQGSTIVSRPKSLPGTAVSSLSGSPRSNNSTPTSRDLASRMEKASESRPFVRHEPTKPVDVPMEPGSHSSGHPHAHYNSDTAATHSDPNLLSNESMTDTYLAHPPRLPLPIEEEVHTPGSPILAPEEQGLPDVGELGESSADVLTRKSSGLSAGTAEDEDFEELRVDKTRPVVPAKLEWKRGGDKIYVTGSIFQWNRKHRLHPVEGKPGCFTATIHVLPGTHHVRFLVDGIMQTSPDLPTTVDFGNNLVNYIEVSPEDAPKTKPPPSSGTSKAADSSDVRASRTSSAQSTARDDRRQAPKGRDVPPLDSYRNEIPQYLEDFDQAEDSPAYQNAVAAIEKLPTPPSLPGFLGKPILNAAVLMKDDNSVLNMPNHTVLNHLATSSIKNGVLAVSATTRYRNKYVTTIIYKPTSADEG